MTLFRYKKFRSALVWAALFALALAGGGCGKKRAARGIRPPRLPAGTVIPKPGDVEHGYASWYGKPYHGRATSSGEIYDMHGMTAAHRTLLFGTEVEVTNLENGDKVVVRINDRGPFIDGRIIDLSLTAAQAIRMVGPGTAMVRMKVVRVPQLTGAPRPPVAANTRVRPPAEVGGPAAAGAAALAGRFTVQVGAFADRRNAERLRASLAERYPEFPVNTAPTPDGARHRVWVGNESSEERAAAIAERLRLDNVTAFVVRLD